MMPCLPRFPHSGEFCCCCSIARTLFYYCAFCSCLYVLVKKIATFNFQNCAELERRFMNVPVPSFARSWARLLGDMPSCISFKYNNITQTFSLWKCIYIYLCVNLCKSFSSYTQWQQIVSDFSQMQQYMFYFYIYLDSMFQSIDHHQIIFTKFKTRCM
jgi:hypothetical protein